MRLVESKKPEAASNISPQNHHHPFPSIKVGLPSPHRSSNEHVQRRLGRKVEPGGSERELRYNLHCAACQTTPECQNFALHCTNSGDALAIFFSKTNKNFMGSNFKMANSSSKMKRYAFIVLWGSFSWTKNVFFRNLKCSWAATK